MFCCTSKRLLLLIAIGVASLLGLAYVFQWQIILGNIPFLLVLACPLLHLFMMGGHGRHADGRDSKKSKSKLSCH